jgi:hypothetical protein
MMRLLLLLFVLYLLWLLYMRLRRGAAPRLERARERVMPPAELFAIHYVTSPQGFRQLYGALPVESETLALLEHGVESDGTGSYVVGSLQNVGRRRVSAEVVVGLYDRRGKLLGKLVAAKPDFAPDYVWTFRAKVAKDGASHYRILELRSF